MKCRIVDYPKIAGTFFFTEADLDQIAFVRVKGAETYIQAGDLRNFNFQGGDLSPAPMAADSDDIEN
jgi:hypothetical protein